MDKVLKYFNNEWFFSKPSSWARYLLIFVKGDSIVLYPLLLIILLFGLFSFDFMLMLVGLFIGIRGLGEMIFWLLQQFGNHTYRPFDFGLKQLNNNAVYIIYQLLGLTGAVAGFGLLLLVLYF